MVKSNIPIVGPRVRFSAGASDTVAERLRRSTRNRLGLSRAGSSPVSVVLALRAGSGDARGLVITSSGPSTGFCCRTELERQESSLMTCQGRWAVNSCHARGGGRWTVGGGLIGSSFLSGQARRPLVLVDIGVRASQRSDPRPSSSDHSEPRQGRWGCVKEQSWGWATTLARRRAPRFSRSRRRGPREGGRARGPLDARGGDGTVAGVRAPARGVRATTRTTPMPRRHGPGGDPVLWRLGGVSVVVSSSWMQDNRSCRCPFLREAELNCHPPRRGNIG